MLLRVGPGAARRPPPDARCRRRCSALDVVFVRRPPARWRRSRAGRAPSDPIRPPVAHSSSLEAAQEFFESTKPQKSKAYGRMSRALMHELNEEQASLRRSRRKYELPKIHTGDVVKVTYFESCAAPPAVPACARLRPPLSQRPPHATASEANRFSPSHTLAAASPHRMTDKKEASFQGVVLGTFNKRVMESIELRNVVDGVPIELRIPLNSPLITDVTVVAPRLKEQRQKIYYLRDRPLVESQFDDLALTKRGTGKKTRKKKQK